MCQINQPLCLYFYFSVSFMKLTDLFFGFFFPFIFIGWRLITLQYCSGFCQTLT